MNCAVITCAALVVVIASVTAQLGRSPLDRARDVSFQETEQILAECRRRIAINDTISHYVGVPSDCSAYAACEYPERDLQATIMLCPPGLFFDDTIDPNMLTCNRPALVNCFSRGSRDPCLGMPDGFNPDNVRLQSDQGAYYECRGGRTIGGGQCDVGEQYWRVGQACVAIPDYNPRPTPAPTPPPCILKEVFGDRGHFMLGGMTMACAMGTVYKPEKCICGFA